MQTRIQQLSLLKPDKLILNYAFSQQAIIGRGSYGIVYVGKHIETNQIVAIKVVPSCSDQQTLRKEIDIMKDLNCPNIVKLLDVLQTPNNCYIISELCTGGDLREYMKTHGAIQEQQALQILIQILKGILQSFKRGIVHRDLKPANILVAQNNIFKIADFGFAKRFQHLEGDIMSSLAGTPLYMSPQVLLRRQYTSKCDVWSVGLIYYELIEGRTPWNVLDILDLVNKQRNTSIKFSKKVSTLSQQFIVGCLQYEEHNRLGWEQIFTHQLFENKFLKESQIKNAGSSQIGTATKLYSVNAPPVTKSPLQVCNKHCNKQTKSLKQIESPSDYRTNSHSKTLFLVKDRTISTSDYTAHNKQIIVNQIEFLLLLKQIRLQLLDYVQVATQTTTVQKLQFMLLKNIMIKTTNLKQNLIDQQINILDLKDFDHFINTDVFRSIEKQILELHYDNFNTFQECQLSLNEKINLFINDTDFLDIFDNNFEQSIQFCLQAKHLALEFIRSYLYQIILGYENPKIQLFAMLLCHYAQFIGTYSTDVESFLKSCRGKSNRSECINLIERLVFN